MHKRRGSESASSANYRDFEKREASHAFMIARVKWSEPVKISMPPSQSSDRPAFFSDESKFHSDREKTTLASVFMDPSHAPWSASEPDGNFLNEM